jgi:beta-glucanase (GH16 family)
MLRAPNCVGTRGSTVTRASHGGGDKANEPAASSSRHLIGRALATFVGVACLAGALVAALSGDGGATNVANGLSLTTTTTTPPFVAPTSTVPQTTTSDGQSDCGGVTMDKPDGTPWVCTFDDEFDGTTLDTSKWTVVTTAATGYKSGSECFVDDPQNVSVSGGTLNLTVAKVPAFACKGHNTDQTVQYTGGMVFTKDTFSQTYGYFEVKAQLPAATIQGLQSSLWLWPENDTYYGPTWPDSGEIDFAEWYTQYPDLVVPYVHYNVKGDKYVDPNRTNTKCSIENPNAYNTYAVIWTNQTITVQMDGQNCLVDNWTPAGPEVKPAPFNMPFYLNLTAAIGIDTNTATTNTPKELPATTNIDWVRVWS